MVEAKKTYTIRLDDHVFTLTPEQALELQVRLDRVLSATSAYPIGRIKAITCVYYRVPQYALDGKRGTDKTVRARWIAMQICRDIGLGITEIAEAFHRSKGDVSFALKALKSKAEAWKGVEKELGDVRARVAAAFPALYSSKPQESVDTTPSVPA